MTVATLALSHLDELEAEAITIIREVAAECERPVLLFSGGKDSAVLAHLALLAFAPQRLPFPLLHVDTGHNFPEALAFRDEFVARHGIGLLVASVEDTIATGKVPDPGPEGSRNRLQSVTLLDALAEHRVDVAFGGGRRDEDRARAKERVLSVRDSFGQWDPRRQRPEPWALLNAHLRPGEHLRAFPLSNWTELDVWRYIERERVELPSLYFAHSRPVVQRGGMLLATGGPIVAHPTETVSVETVRYRTVGDMSCTGAVRSTATTVADVIAEVERGRVSERGATRADDQISESAMEDRKKEGYF